MAVNWTPLFDIYGIKKVTATDKSHQAYIPNEDQRRALDAAGILPSTIRPTPSFSLTVLFDISRDRVDSGYYHSVRSAVAARPPEPRMGKELIRDWLSPGDELLIGNIGAQIFACKMNSVPPSSEVVAEEVACRSTRASIIARANAATGWAGKRKTIRTEYSRNPFVVLGAIERAAGNCETPGCRRVLFKKDDGSSYLEVHHIIPLSEYGRDTLRNVAAICPHCHRELHYGINRVTLRTSLLHHIAGKLLC